MEDRYHRVEARERTRRALGWQIVAACLILCLFGIPLYIIMWQHWTLISDALLLFGGCVMFYLIGLMGLHLRSRYLSIKVYKPLPAPKPAPKVEKYIPAYVDSDSDTIDEWEGWDEPQ